MKNHIKVYRKHFNLGEQDFPLCEYCRCREAVDVHHITPRGMGGFKNLDTIENLIGLCRSCHIEAEAKRIEKQILQDVHNKNLDSGIN